MAAASPNKTRFAYSEPRKLNYWQDKYPILVFLDFLKTTLLLILITNKKKYRIMSFLKRLGKNIFWQKKKFPNFPNSLKISFPDFLLFLLFY